jgi:hypothetical protein
MKKINAKDLRKQRIEKHEISEVKSFYDPNKTYKLPDLRVFGQIFKKKDSRCLLINMELYSGFVDMFLVEEYKKAFVFNKATYIIDLNMKYWNIQAKYYALDYHEGFDLPISRHLDIERMNDAIEKTGEYDCETATNPFLLRQFMTSNIVEQVISGAQLSKWLNAMKIMVLVTMIFGVLNAIFSLILLFLAGKGGK